MKILTIRSSHVSEIVSSFEPDAGYDEADVDAIGTGRVTLHLANGIEHEVKLSRGKSRRRWISDTAKVTEEIKQSEFYVLRLNSDDEVQVNTIGFHND
jgi:hypothetical protein